VHTDQFLGHFLRHLLWSLEIAALDRVGSVLLLLTGGLALSCVWQQPSETGRWKRSYWLVFTQSLLLIAGVVVGVLFQVVRNPPLRPEVNPIGAPLVGILLFLSLGWGFFLVYRMKGVRWVGFCLVALQELFLLTAAFIAYMSVKGTGL
jgi:hypothetical protein